jgi:hypothetical protein
MNRCHVVRPERENARIAPCFHDLSPQVLDGTVMHGTETSALGGQRGLRCQTHPGHRDLFGVVRSGVGNEGEEQYPHTGHFLLHGHPLWNPGTAPRECAVFTLTPAYEGRLVDFGPLTPNHRVGARRDL